MSRNKSKGDGTWQPLNRTARQEMRRWRRMAFRATAEPGAVALIRRTWSHGIGLREGSLR